MEIPSENLTLFIIHRRPPHPHLTGGDEITTADGEVYHMRIESIAIKSSELEKTGFDIVSAPKSPLIQQQCSKDLSIVHLI